MKVQSNVTGLIWDINTKRKLSDEDIKFIESFNPDIFHNDLDCNLWCFDEKLPSGSWLENITFNNELTQAKALVL